MNRNTGRRPGVPRLSTFACASLLVLACSEKTPPPLSSTDGSVVGGQDTAINVTDTNQPLTDSQTDAPLPNACKDISGTCLMNPGTTMVEDVRVAENGIANLIADFYLAEAKKLAQEQVDVAFLRAGSIRAGFLVPPDYKVFTSDIAKIGKSYPAGALTDDDIKGWYPYVNNDYILMTLTGLQIKRSLESAVRRWADTDGTTFGSDLTASQGGEFLHPAGLKYEVKCEGTQRIVIEPTGCDNKTVMCTYKNPTTANAIDRMEIGGVVYLENGAWKNGGDTKTFRVILDSFAAGGRDMHLDFKDGTNQKKFLAADFKFVDKMLEFVKGLSPITLKIDNRIVVKGKVNGVSCNLPAKCTPEHGPTHPNCAHLKTN